MKRSIVKSFLALMLCCSMMISSSTIVLADGEADEIQIEKENMVESFSMTDKQLSAISMLNYLTVLSQEINSSPNSKLYLDNVYSSIVNNINPNAVDNDSMSEIKELLNTINAYQSIVTKRERLQYIYEQNQANAIQKALPDPMSVLNVIQAKNPAKALVSVVYMAVDSKSSYDSYVSEVDSKYMQDGWELDDAAFENLHESRSDAFAYMVEMCNKNNLDGKLALNENAVADFVKWENEPNVTRRIDFLEKKEKTYSAYGKYWLVLAESYYDNSDYQKCLNCIDKYEAMNIVTFRRDHDLAKALVMGLAAANEKKKGVEYVKTAEHYLDLMLVNIETNDYTLRYVAAESYMDLYSKTKDKDYLKKAYDLAEENVNYLIDEQTNKNDIYLAEVKKQSAKKNDSDATKEEIKKYNKWIEEERKTELPPVYQPLLINCELLFGLADELSISATTKKKVNNMLHSDEGPLFLTLQLEHQFWFDSTSDYAVPDVSFDGSELVIPANILAQGAKIKATLKRGNTSVPCTDWVLDEVDRNKETSVDKFKAIYKSKLIKKYDYKDGDKVVIEIIPTDYSSYGKLTYTFGVSVTKKLKVLTNAVFTLEK